MGKKFLIFVALVLVFTGGIGTSFNAAEAVEKTNTESDYMKPEGYDNLVNCGSREFYLVNSYFCPFSSTTEPIAYAQLDNNDDVAGTYQGGQADLWLDACNPDCRTISSWGNVYLGPGRYMRIDYYVPNPDSSTKWWQPTASYDYMDNGYQSLYSAVS